MILANQKALWLIIYIIPIIFLMIASYRYKAKDLKIISGTWREKKILNIFIVKWFFSNLFFILFLFFSVLSLTGISWGSKSVIEERKGIDIAFLIDVSKSMNAFDVKPSRLERAKYLANGIIDGFKGNRFSIVVFKGKGIKLIPSTEDTASLKNYINSLDSNIITSPGTNLADGIEQAVDSFPDGLESNKFIIILSDGESMQGEERISAIKAFNKNIIIYSAGIGTETGSPIPIGKNEYIKDKKGQYIISKLNKDTLKAAAETTKGAYFSGADHRILSSIMKDIDTKIKNRTKSIYRLEMINHFRFFVIIALICLLLSKGIEIIRWKENI